LIMRMLLVLIFDRSESQKPTRTSTLVTVPRYPIKAIAGLVGSQIFGVAEVHSDDVVIASLLYFAVWNSEQTSCAQLTVDNIANSVCNEDNSSCSVSSIRCIVFVQ